MIGIIVKAISGFYYVSTGNTVYECKARGSFRNKGISPLVGDRVEFTAANDNKGVIDAVFERKNQLSRPAIANIDKLFIVSSYSTPSPDTLLIDRLISIAEYNNIEPIIIFNKSDMGSFDFFEKLYKNAGFKTYVVSAVTGLNMDAILTELKDCVVGLAGNSGVGKSSILNALFPELCLKTGDVSLKLGRGKHTTRHTELFCHANNGYIADTPGFAALESNVASIDYKNNLASTFREFSSFVNGCRFLDCNHICENGCAVINAVNCGKIEKSRHESYVKIFNELKALKEWEINR